MSSHKPFEKNQDLIKKKNKAQNSYIKKSRATYKANTPEFQKNKTEKFIIHDPTFTTYE